MQKTKRIAKQTYTMRGLETERELDVHHLIVAPSFACNMRCRHCYLPDHNPECLSEDTTLKLVDDWNDIGLKGKVQSNRIFHIKGGEPFLIPYFWKLVDKIVSKKSLRLMLTTNGTFSDENTIRKLVLANNELNGNLTIIVSLDGATEESNAKLRGKSHFKKVLKFLGKLQKNAVNYYLNCVLHKGNIDELDEYIQLAKKFDATQINFLNFIPYGNAVNIEYLQVPHLKVYENFARIYEQADEQTKAMLTGSIPEIKLNEKEGYLFTSNECVAGYEGLLYIIPDGNVFTCPNVVCPDNKLGNVKENSLQEIINNTERLYNNLQSFSGQYQCTGERKVYLNSDDFAKLELLDEFSRTLKSDVENKNKFSYCYNRNF